MAKTLTAAELAEIGKRVIEQAERAKVRGKARNRAIQKLINANQDQFDAFLEEEKRRLGVT